MLTKIKKAPLAHKLVILNLGSLVFILSLVHFYVFPIIENMFIDSYKMKIRNAVEIANHLIIDYHARAERGEMTQDEAKKQAMTAIKALRYNETEYFWIHNSDLKMVMHAMQPKLDGTDISEKKDPQGVAIFAEMNRLSEKTGSTFLQYMWPKPGSDVPVEKYSYVQVFKPWGWITGNGIYFDQIRATVSALRWAIYGGLGFAAFLSCLGTVLFSRSLIRNFNEALHSLEDAGTEMTSLSSSLAETGRNVSEGVSESAASITETSASMEEIGLMSQKNADHSSKTQSSANECLSATQQGKKIVERAMVCMSDISKSNGDVLEQNKQSAQRISEIVHLIRNIGEKTKVINDIVFQTKILSFNASVEAARAGESGKGFSIVAEEVGKLAEMSGEAAKAIETSLAGSISKVESIIREDIAQSQQTISSAGKKVEEGMSVVKSCESVFDQIISQVTEVVDLANQISASSQEQRIGFDQVNKAVLQLNQASNLNAHASEEVASSVEKIVGQAEIVQNYSRLLTRLIKGEAASAENRVLATATVSDLPKKKSHSRVA
jgi:methyl-accepting chemotaxis protein